MTYPELLAEAKRLRALATSAAIALDMASNYGAHEAKDVRDKERMAAQASLAAFQARPEGTLVDDLRYALRLKLENKGAIPAMHINDFSRKTIARADQALGTQEEP